MPVTILLLAASLVQVPAPPEGGPTASGAPPPVAVRLPIEALELANGMRFLLVPRPRSSTVVAGWTVRSGSAEERPDERGASHLLEHMLFKGTRTIGTRDAEREAELLRAMDDALAELGVLRTRGARPRRLDAARARFEALRDEARSLQFLGEYSLHYSRAGAVGLDASTFRDLAIYQVALPAEKLELWFWLESDRLLAPVFRELDKERRILGEEHRLRVGSTPTGALDEAVDAAFWAGTPYAWRPLSGDGVGETLDRPALRDYFARHYRPAGLTAALVGRFEPQAVRALAERYFGRLPGAAAAPRPAREPFSARPRRERFEGRCDCPAQARVLYPTVPFRHPDSYALQVLAGLMNGRSGRLYRSLVLDRGLAFSAAALETPLARAGRFEFSAEARGATAPEELVAAWDRELADLLAAPIDAAELERVRNQITADAFRRLRDPEALLRQLLLYDGLGDWREIVDWPARISSVSGEEVRRVARRLLAPERRLVAVYRPRAEAPLPESPLPGGPGPGGSVPGGPLPDGSDR